MKNLHLIVSLVLISFFGISQNKKTVEKKQVSVSKYRLKLNKNTKEKLPTKEKKETLKFESRGQSNFDYHYHNYLISDASNKDYKSLLVAYDLKPNNSELYFEMAKYYELLNDSLSKKIFCKKLKATKLSSGLKEYAYNTLMSVEENGILITYGEDDTYPIWILQSLENVRRDVKILHYDLLVNTAYRKRVSQEMGLVFSKTYRSNIDVLKDIAIKNSKQKLYYSLTVSHLILKQLKGKLYSTGLALKYSNTSFDNLEMLKSNWGKFKKKKLNTVKIGSMESKLFMNYSLSLFQLYKYYKRNSDLEKSVKIKDVLLKIGTQAGKEKEIKELIKKA